MRHVTFAVVLALLAASSARADLKITQNVAGRGMGMGASTVTVTYIKDLKMRSDTTTGDTVRTMIFDVENQKMFIFDSKKKEADVWDMADFGKQIGSTVDPAGMTASFKPNGQTKPIAGKTATGYDMGISLPSRIGGAKDGLAMTVSLSGPIWIVKGAPGTADFQRFYTAAAEKGFIFSDPRAAKAQPGQAKATTEMYREMAATGGVPYETEMNFKMSGEGPMGGIMARMGNLSMTTVVQSVETAALADDLFAPPVGYKLNQKK